MLLALSLAFSPAALAASPDLPSRYTLDVLPTEEIAVEEKEKSGDGKEKSGGGKKKSGSGGTSSKSSGSMGSGSDSGSKSNDDDGDSDEGQIFDRVKIGKWKFQPYISPGGGATINTSGEKSVSVGGAVGATYWRKKKSGWAGDVHLGADYMLGTAQNGYAVNLVDTLSKRGKYAGATFGLDAFYQNYSFSGGSAGAGTPGIGIPLAIVLGPKTYYGFVTYEPRIVAGGTSAGLFDYYTASLGAGMNSRYGQYEASVGVTTISGQPAMTADLGTAF